MHGGHCHRVIHLVKTDLDGPFYSVQIVLLYITDHLPVACILIIIIVHKCADD